VFIRALLTVKFEKSWHHDNIDDIKEWENAKKQNKRRQKTTLNNRLKQTKLSLQLFLNLQYVAFVSIFLSGIILLRQENEHYSKYL
jgi:hypothetical protein